MQTTLDKYRKKKPVDKRRARLKSIAEDTLTAIENGFFVHNDVHHDLGTSIASSTARTKYFAPNSLLSLWSSVQPASPTPQTEVSIREISSIDGVRLLSATAQPGGSSPRIGLLNFASATKPGGGFLNGAQAQEESLARSSTLYPTLISPAAEAFYVLHKENERRGLHSHAMVFSPGVIFFRDDAGGWTEPCTADVLTSAAVNARVVRQRDDGDEAQIARIMRERMARILFLFEKQGVRNLVLGSFGTGVFENDVTLVAGIWRELLVAEQARFKRSFDKVLFAILGRYTFQEFSNVFEDTPNADVS